MDCIFKTVFCCTFTCIGTSQNPALVKLRNEKPHPWHLEHEYKRPACCCLQKIFLVTGAATWTPIVVTCCCGSYWSSVFSRRWRRNDLGQNVSRPVKARTGGGSGQRVRRRGRKGQPPVPDLWVAKTSCKQLEAHRSLWSPAVCTFSLRLGSHPISGGYCGTRRSLVRILLGIVPGTLRRPLPAEIFLRVRIHETKMCRYQKPEWGNPGKTSRLRGYDGLSRLTDITLLLFLQRVFVSAS